MSDRSHLSLIHNLPFSLTPAPTYGHGAKSPHARTLFNVNNPQSAVEQAWDDGLFRPVVVGCVSDMAGRILVVQSAKAKSEFGLPQGGIDSDEKLSDALPRELYEELRIFPEHVQLRELVEIRDIEREAGRSQRDGFTIGSRYFMQKAVYVGNRAIQPNPQEIESAVWVPRSIAKAALRNKRPEKKALLYRTLDTYGQ